MKIIYTTLILYLTVVLNCYSQNYWNDSLINELGKKEVIEKLWIIDTFQIHKRSSPIGVNSIKNISQVSEFLNEHKELNIKIVLESSKWLKKRSNDIYKSLIYFNVEPERIEVRDSIFDISNKLQIARRLVSVKFEQEYEYSKTLANLNEAFQNRDKKYLNEFISSFKNKNSSVKPRNEKVGLLQIDKLIESFHQEFYTKSGKAKYSILPQNYILEIGEATRFTSESGYDEDLEMYIAESDYTYINNPVRYTYKYYIDTPTDNTIFLSEVLRKATISYLGFDFNYSLDSMFNIPSNIKPVNMTKSKLEFIKNIFSPKYKYLVRDYCNGYMFWDHHWELQDLFTIKRIQIDEESRIAFLTFYDLNIEEKLVSYEYKDGNWILSEYDKNKYKSNTWIYLIVIIFTLLLGSILKIKKSA